MDGLTYYDVLGVPRDADEQTVRRAYRAQQRATHPDTTGVDSHVQYDLVMRAGQSLTDPAKRAAYDATLADAQAPESAPEPEPPAPDPAEDDGWGVWGEVPAAGPVVDEAPPSGLAAPETVWGYARRGGIRAAVLGLPVLLAALLLAWAGRSAPAATLLAPLVAAAVLAVWASRRRVSARARRIVIVTVVAVVTCVWWRQGAPEGFLAALSLGACSLVPLSPFIVRYVLE